MIVKPGMLFENVSLCAQDVLYIKEKLPINSQRVFIPEN